MTKPKDVNQPVTIGDFQEFTSSVGEAITKVVRQEVSGQLEPLREEMRQWKNDILNSNDKLMHEVKTMREEQTVHSGSHRDITDDSEDLKRRVKRLEAHAGVRS